MKIKGFFITLGLVIIVLIGYRFFWNNQKQALAPSDTNKLAQVKENKPVDDQNKRTDSKPVTDNSASQAPSKPVNSTTTVSSVTPQATFSSGAEADLGPDIAVLEVDYNGTVFSPATLNIKVGDYVIFKNKEQTDLWVASNPHPTHTDYPEFNSQKPIPPGGKYQFEFSRLGNWGYHNHLNPAATGVVNVARR